MLKVLSIVSFVLMMLALVGLLLDGSLLLSSIPVIVAQFVGLTLILWARWTFGFRSFHPVANPTPGGLVTTGPYRLIRHPIYAGACLIGAAGSAGHPTLLSVVFVALLFAAAFCRMLCEEQLVAEIYPDYRDYARRTRRMIPYLL